jgi:hypothetical protein
MTQSSNVPPLNRRHTNPIALRIWFTRLLNDTDFAHVVEDLRSINADRVYLFDNGYMDNFQLAPETLAERVPVLRRRIAQLREEGIAAGINSGATIGHGGWMQGAERLMDLDWWTGADGKPLVGIACPLGQRYLHWLEDYFRALASARPSAIYIDDDFRLGNHGAPYPGEWGCFCDHHLQAMHDQYGHHLTRDALIDTLTQLQPTAVSQDWITLWKHNFLECLARIERVVHEVDPEIRLGLMPVQNFIRGFGEDFLQQAIAIVSGQHRPLLRTHDYHGLPHEMVPGSGLAAKRTAPSASEHEVEIENTPHNHHEFVRSPKTTRFAILNALALGMGGAAITFGDSERIMDWERAYLDMLRESDPYFRTVADLTMRDTTMRGVPLRNRAYQRRVTHIDAVTNIIDQAQDEMPDMLANILGFAYHFTDEMPALLVGELPASMTRDEVLATLQRGAIIDAPAVDCLNRLGYAEWLGVTAGDLIPYRRGHHFLDHPLNGEYAGDTNALRVIFPARYLEAHSGLYEEVTEFVSWAGTRVAGGILVRADGANRNIILPFKFSPADIDSLTGIVNTQFRALLRHMLAHVLGHRPSLVVEGPTNIAPYYFERTSDDAVIITLLNRYYDDVADFDLVLGDGERVIEKPVRRVMPDGSLQLRPSLRVVPEANGAARLHIDRENALLNCDVMVLQIGGA